MSAPVSIPSCSASEQPLLRVTKVREVKGDESKGTVGFTEITYEINQPENPTWVEFIPDKSK